MGDVFLRSQKVARGMMKTLALVLSLVAMALAANTPGGEILMEDANDGPLALCSDAQNKAKTTTAEAAMDCGQNKCQTAKTAEEQTKCVCKNCGTEQKAAQTAGCACGLDEQNAAKACATYTQLVQKCSSG